MAARKGRSPVASSITQESIEQANIALTELPEKPKTHWSLRETIRQLQGTINTAIERGYSHQEIAAMLAEQGIRISPTSLKAYLSASNREAGVTPKRRRTVKASAAPAPAADSTSEATPEPKKTRSPRTSSKAKAEEPAKGKKAAAETTTTRTRRKKTGTAAAS